jgi:hypothetical protein
VNWNVVIAVVVSVGAWAVFHCLEGKRFASREAAWGQQILAYEREIERLYSDNKDLRDRLFGSKAMPPSDIDLTQVYEERKKNEREHKEQTKGKHVPPGALERIAEKWKAKDLQAADRGEDLTVSSKRVN